MGVCVTLTDDCLQHLVRQLDVKALVRSGAVCKAWRQAATTPEPWELLYEASWGDSELVEGCSSLRESYRVRYETLAQLPQLLKEWSECAEKVERTTAGERVSHLESAQGCSERLLRCARHHRLALDSLSRTPQEEEVAQAAAALAALGGERGAPALPIPLETLRARCVARSRGEIRRAAAHAVWLVKDASLGAKWEQLLGNGAQDTSAAAAGILVEEGACLIAELERDVVDRAAIGARLDSMAQQVRAMLDPETATVEKVLGAMNTVLFEREGLRGNSESYYEAGNSYITDVLERGLGIPISLAVVYMCVGRRVGVRLEGVNAPGHFLLRTRKEEREYVYVDVFAGGTLLDIDGVQSLLQRFGWPPQHVALPSCPPRVLFARMLRNVANTLRPPEGGGENRGDGVPSRRTHLFVLCLAQLVQVMKFSGEDGVQFYEPEIALFRATGAARILNP